MSVSVILSHPERVVFPQLGLTKADLADYYRFVAAEVLRGVAGRPMILRRYLHGADGEHFFQKRVPAARPEWLQTAVLHYASGHWTEEAVVHDIDGVLWAVNLGCIDLNPMPVRADDLAHPDRLRVDLDPQPGVPWAQIVDVALLAHELLGEQGLTGFVKTSGKRGLHVDVPIDRRWTPSEVRTAALNLARRIEQRSAGAATSVWKKADRQGVFVDYNQNAYDRYLCSAYSVRPTPDARVSTPLAWGEVQGCDPAEHTIETVPDRVDDLGDPWALIDRVPKGDLGALLAG